MTLDINELPKILSALPILCYRPKEFDDWGTIRVEASPDADFRDHFCQIRWPFADSDECARHRAAKTDPWQSAAVGLVSLRDAFPALLDEVETLRAKIERLRFEAAEGSPLDRLEWVIGTLTSGEMDQDERRTIADAIVGAMTEIRRLQSAENEGGL